MIPYYTVPDLVVPLPFGWTLFGADHITLHVFGLLVAIAVVVGHWQAMKYAQRHGLSQERLAHMIGPMLIAGLRRPWRVGAVAHYDCTLLPPWNIDWRRGCGAPAPLIQRE